MTRLFYVSGAHHGKILLNPLWVGRQDPIHSPRAKQLFFAKGWYQFRSFPYNRSCLAVKLNNYFLN